MAYMDHKNLANQQISDQRAQEIADNVHRVQERIAQAAQSAGRDAGDVTLLAATKTRDVGEIMAALQAGIRTIGENRPQELTAKVEGLQAACQALGWRYGATLPAVERAVGVIDVHCIGQLQTNKINKVLPIVNTVESVDSLELAQKIAKRVVARNQSLMEQGLLEHGLLEQGNAGADNADRASNAVNAGAIKPLGVLLEVNESGEASKSGCDPEMALDLAYAIAQCEGLQLQGFMTIGAHVNDERVIREGFAHLRSLRDIVLASGESGTQDAHTLSMGMSGDLQYAIEEGSTQVRVGTALFGERAFI